MEEGARPSREASAGALVAPDGAGVPGAALPSLRRRDHARDAAARAEAGHRDGRDAREPRGAGARPWSGPASPPTPRSASTSRATRSLGAVGRRSVSRAVFSYFRWLHWLDPGESAQRRIVGALGLQARFERDPSSVKAEALAARAVPAWLGGEMDLPAGFLRQLQREPPLWIRAKVGAGGRGGPEASAPAGSPGLPGPVSAPAELAALRYRGTADLHKAPGFQSGAFEIQDLSSQLVGHACAPQPGETWWDACAGEGGKALHLSDLMRNKGLDLGDGPVPAAALGPQAARGARRRVQLPRGGLDRSGARAVPDEVRRRARRRPVQRRRHVAAQPARALDDLDRGRPRAGRGPGGPAGARRRLGEARRQAGLFRLHPHPERDRRPSPTGLRRPIPNLSRRRFPSPPDRPARGSRCSRRTSTRTGCSSRRGGGWA